MPNELAFRVALHGGFLPGLAAFSVLLALWWRHARRTRSPDAPAGVGPVWALPLLIVLGVVAADWVAKQSFAWWPADNTRRLGHAALLVGATGAVMSVQPVPVWARVIARVVAFGAVAWMLTEGYRPGVLSDGQMWALVGACAGVGAALATLADASLARTAGWAGPAAVLALLALFQPFLHFAGYSSGSIAMTGALAAVSAALLVAARFRTLRIDGVGTVTTGLVLIGLLGAGVQSEPKSLLAIALAAACPIALGVRLSKPLPTLLLRAGLAGATAGAALGVLALAPSEPDPYADWTLGRRSGSDGRWAVTIDRERAFSSATP